MEHITLYPIDTIKTHLQASGRKLNFWSTGRMLYMEEGLARFWKGANVVASGCVPAHGAQFVVYELMKANLNYNNENYDMLVTLGIGAATTWAHDFFISPSDVIKQRLQLCKSLTATQCIRNILTEEGIWGLYRSYPLTVFMNIPYTSMVVCVNENMKTLIRPWETDHPHFWYFVSAGVAGGVAGVATNPLDVVKTRIQTQEI
mmetsp:Transcript_17014/g.26255  ORF Transcript_17014/g.26255 Transcript_17014/m.26255 type:complete len:203 (+) Transcript_17014:233-841(+)